MVPESVSNLVWLVRHMEYIVHVECRQLVTSTVEISLALDLLLNF